MVNFLKRCGIIWCPYCFLLHVKPFSKDLVVLSLVVNYWGIYHITDFP